MTRLGLNAKFSYSRGGRTHSYQVRASGVSHGIQPIFTESAARVRKVYYPHRVSLTQFGVQVELLDEAEYISLSSWMADYADWALNSSAYDVFPYMLVFIPSRNFYRRGVPVSGFEWGDRAARVDWGYTIAFETVDDFGVDGLQHATTKSEQSRATGPALTENTTKYFYPTGTQLSGQNAPPDGTYQVAITQEDITGPPPEQPPPSPPKLVRPGPVVQPPPFLRPTS